MILHSKRPPAWPLCSLALLLLCAQSKSQPQPEATVTLLPIDQDGLAVTGYHVENFTDRYETDMASYFHGLRGSKIPFGQYTYVLTEDTGGGNISLRGRGVVSDTDTLIVAAYSPSDLRGFSRDIVKPKTFQIRGSIQPTPTTEAKTQPVRVRLLPIDGRDHLDLRVDESGEFRTSLGLSGRYLLAVIRGNEVLAVQQVSFEQDIRPATFVVKIPEVQPPISHVRGSEP
jgi:hypothetical protein